MHDAGEKTAVGAAIQRTGGASLWGTASLLALLLIAYAGAFDAAWHYDDFINIVDNPKIRMDTLSWSNLAQSTTAGRNHGVIGRPLAYLSFALNYRLGGYQVFGYHTVNFCIHWLTAAFLFFLIRRILKLPRFEGRYDTEADVTAWLAATLWAVHPIHVTAVTYVVQRMASMAGLFYVMTMFFYLKARLAAPGISRGVYLCLSVFVFACAVMTKENAVMALYAVWLFDLLLLRRSAHKQVGKHLLRLLALTAGAVLIGLLYVDPGKLFAPFDARPFTLAERLMTQPRVLFFYLFLLAVPMTSRLSLVHDIEISRALLTPWTTLVALAALVFVLTGLVLLTRRRPLLAWCGLFFFINHIVEGSIFNLELIYEHRNYIPSMFLFLPVSMGIMAGFRRFGGRPALRWMLVGLSAMLVLSPMHATLGYNRVFSSGLSLWSDVVAKYPRHSLGHLNLSKVYWGAGSYEKSAEQNRAALDLNRFNNFRQKGFTHYNLGLYAAAIDHDADQAAYHFEKALAIVNSSGMRMRIARAWMQLNDYHTALNLLKSIKRNGGNDSELHRMMGLASLKTKDYDAAIAYAQKAMDSNEADAYAQMILAQSYRYLSKREQAFQIMERLHTKDPKNMVVLLALMELSAERQDMRRIARLRRQVMALTTASGTSGGGLPDVLAGRSQHGLLPYAPDHALLKRLMAGDAATEKQIGHD